MINVLITGGYSMRVLTSPDQEGSKIALALQTVTDSAVLSTLSNRLVYSPTRGMALILRIVLLLGCVHVIYSTCPPCVCSTTAYGKIIANCSNRMLTSVPPNITSNVSHLLMSNNSINETGQFKRFTSMEYLDLSHNELTSLDVHSFEGAVNLTFLNLHGNGLLLNNISYPDRTFQNQTKLQYLNISGNARDLAAKYPDVCLGNLVALQTFIVDGIENVTFGEGFAKLKNLTILSLSGKGGNCSIDKLYNESFQNTPNLRHLDISYCDISFIEPNAFGPLRNIETLDLSFNTHLGFDKLGDSLYGLQHSPLRVLKFNGIVRPHAIGIEMTAHHLRYLDNMNLMELHCDANRIERLGHNCSGKLNKVQIVSAQGNRFTFGYYIFTLAKMKNLRKLYLMNQYPSSKITLPPEEAVDGEGNHLMTRRSLERKPVFKQDPEVFQRHNDINIDSSLTENSVLIPPNLTFVNASMSTLDYTITEIYFIHNKVKVLDLSRNVFSELKGPIRGVDFLEFLDLTDGYCKLIFPTFFMYASNLKVLNMSKNYLSHSLQSDVHGHLFFNLTKLEILRLSNNILLDLPSPIFKSLYNLRILDLSWNTMKTWTVMISHMSFLTSLDLSNNKFEYVPKYLTDQIGQIMKPRNDTFHMNIQGNNLICDCSTLQFLEALSKARISIERPNVTRCRFTNGERTTFHNIDNIVWKLQQQCKIDAPLFAATLSGIIIFLLIVAGGVIYRYRWKIRYLYYTTRRKYRGYQRLQGQEEEENFTYDAFVSYADEDRGFVVEDMRHMLERHYGLRLCIHHRDFMVGEAITANIINAVQASRKTIILLSPNFSKSAWCDYEVHMAKLESIHTGRDVLCVVWYSDVPDTSRLSRDLQDEIRYGTYMRYPTTEDEKPEFWERLKATISCQMP
ncbi:toll-like receptor 4 [Haliotis rubra]|uniref:toll-like receptor 4 n=1 Tax=Haliotis rubra TaxID=36100 RepID=UPI001EE624C1|nr:toll-like receptor 4 [Haliotis rubra]